MPRKQRAPQGHRYGQIGEYWVAKRPGRDAPEDAWCRSWYDRSNRNTRYLSLGETDLSTAINALHLWYAQRNRPRHADPSGVAIDAVMLAYWTDHAQHLASHRTEFLALGYWTEHFSNRPVSDLTPDGQDRFRKWLVDRPRDGKSKQPLAASGIDRILDTGRAALNHARKQQMITTVPHIFRLLKAAAKRSRAPKGRPIGPEEIAKLIDAAESWHMLMFVLIAANTLARPEAIVQLGPDQFDREHNLLDLNPAGREQNNKHRPIVPVTPTLQRFLAGETGKSCRFVSYRDKPIKEITAAWRITRAAAGLPDDVTPYSVRHGMARELRKRRVPTEQISLMLGHLPKGSDATTSIYAPYDPDYCSDAAVAIEAVMGEIRGHLKTASLDRGAVAAVDALIPTGKAVRKGIGEAKREEIRRLILAGVPHREVVAITGVSGGTVSVIRQDLKEHFTLYRATGARVCAPFAHHSDSELGSTYRQVLEKIGGPGKIRTCDNTVMSGGF